MKKLLFIILIVLQAVQLFAQNIPPRPNPPKLVNDLVGLLSSSQVEELENKVDKYNDSTSNQIAIVIVGTLNDNEPVDYAVKLGREWGVGSKDFNNGVIILISTGADGSKRKVFIAPGYGLEGALPDITSKQIVDAELIPNLKSGNYYRGLDNAVDAIIKAAAGEYKAPKGYGDRNSKSGRGILVWVIIFIIILIVSNNRRGGGGMMSRRGYGNLIWPLLLGSGGGGWSGGSGGSSGGGGFGGFGGGSFGGGGAGGDW